MGFLNKHITISILSMFLMSGCKLEENKLKPEEKVKKETIEHKVNKIDELKLNEFNMLAHLRSFENIAFKNNGNRAVGTEGGMQSAKYIIDLADKAGFQKTITSFKNKENVTARNIIVEIPGQSKDSIILIGAHYDSVPQGPGINDNATGVSVLLELMNQYHLNKLKPKHTIQLAFWDSEEVGLDGSKKFVENIDQKQLEKIKAYINLDIVGTLSPTATITGVTAKSHIKDQEFSRLLKDFYLSKRIRIKDDLTILDTTDMHSFLGKVPMAGIELLNEENGHDQYIQCYHKACDKVDLIDHRSLDVSGGAVLALIKKIESD